MWIVRQTPPPLLTQEELLFQLRNYLGEFRFQWLCVCAILPSLSPSFTLFLGSELTKNMNELELGMTALSCLPWFRYAYMPQWLRLILLNCLNASIEKHFHQIIEDKLSVAIIKESEFSLLTVSKRKKILSFWLSRNKSIAKDIVLIDFLNPYSSRRFTHRVPNSLKNLLFPDENKHAKLFLSSQYTLNKLTDPCFNIREENQQSGVAEYDSDTDTPFFAVSQSKLLVMLLFTFGLYSIYWFYKNWEHIEKLEKKNIFPPLRAFFSVLWCYSCFSSIRDFGDKFALKKAFSPGSLAVAYIFISLVLNLISSNNGSIIIDLLLIFFLWGIFFPIQAYVNELNHKIVPRHNSNSKLTLWNWIIIITVMLLIILNIIGSFDPEAATESGAEFVNPSVMPDN